MLYLLGGCLLLGVMIRFILVMLILLISFLVEERTVGLDMSFLTAFVASLIYHPVLISGTLFFQFAFLSKCNTL